MKVDLFSSAGVEQERAAELPQRARCKVVSPEPKAETDPLYIVPVGYSAARAYEVAPGHWLPHGSTMPDRHTVCVAVFDHQKDPWVLGWEGFRAGGFLSGHGAPSAGVGLDRDVYLDLDSRNLYGPRDSTAVMVWPGLGRLDPFNAPYPDPI